MCLGFAVSPATTSCEISEADLLVYRECQPGERQLGHVPCELRFPLLWGLRRLGVVHEPDSAELPARRRIEEIPIARARVPVRRRLRASAQHHLVNHELAVVFAERIRRRAIAGIGQIGAARPLPDMPNASSRSLRALRSPIPARLAGACRPSAQRRPPRSSSHA